MQCDMCGKNSELKKVKIEETILDVCNSCARFGEIQKATRKVYINKKPSIRKTEKETSIPIIVNDYYEIIKKAREKKELTQAEVAQQIAEKESLYHQIERGHKRPSIATAKKLEKFFQIKLVDQYTDKMQAEIAKAPEGKKEFTIGDMIKIKMKK